jgi:hypothetical protein
MPNGISGARATPEATLTMAPSLRARNRGRTAAVTDPADWRGVLACLSLEGRRRLDLAMAQKAAAFNERLSDWEDDDLADLAALLRRLTAGDARGASAR